MLAILTALFALSMTPPAQDSTPKIPADTEVVTLGSGLKYSVLNAGGEGVSPKRWDKVLVHYTGWTEDGKVFDSSRERGVPAEFPVGRLIEGWNEALLLMTPGARWKLTIPSNLGYGERGMPPRIPANATLIFDVELLEVTDRALSFQPWDGERESSTLAGEVEYQDLRLGRGDKKASEFSFVRFRWAAFDGEGKTLFTDTMLGQDLSGSPKQIILPFVRDGLSRLLPGGSCNLKVPKAIGASWLKKLQISEDLEYTIWQIDCSEALSFEKPAFYLPADEDLTTLPSGLKYQVERAGTGKKPAGPQSRVQVHYCGWLTDGKQFDASYDRGEPISFGLSQVIAGWTEGMQLIGEGGAIWLVIPSALGYGEQGAPPDIPGGATLVFFVELISAGA